MPTIQNSTSSTPITNTPQTQTPVTPQAPNQPTPSAEASQAKADANNKKPDDGYKAKKPGSTDKKQSSIQPVIGESQISALGGMVALLGDEDGVQADVSDEGDVDFVLADSEITLEAFAAPLKVLQKKWPQFNEEQQSKAADFLIGHQRALEYNQAALAEQAGIQHPPHGLARTLVQTHSGIFAEFVENAKKLRTHPNQISSSANLDALGNKTLRTHQHTSNAKIIEGIMGDRPVDIMAYVQYVLRESYKENSQNMYHFAQKVKFFNELKKKYREEVARAQKEMAALAGLDPNAPINPPFEPANINTDFVLEDGEATEPLTDAQKALLENYQNALEEFQNQPMQTHTSTLQPGMGGIFAWDVDGDSSNENASINLTEEEIADRVYENSASEFLEQFTEYYNSLSPEEQQGLLEYLRTHGIAMSANGREHDASGGYDDASVPMRVVTMPDDVTDPIAWLAGELKDISGDLATAFIAVDDGDNADVISARINIGFPGPSDFEWEAPGTDFEDFVSSDGVNLSEVRDQMFADPQLRYIVDSTAPRPDWAPIETKAQLEAYIKETESMLQNIGDDAQLANLDLQDTIQRITQLVSMMTNIMKSDDDARQSVIRNYA